MYRNALMWVVIILGMVLLFNMFNVGDGTTKDIPYSEFITKVDAGDVADVEIKNRNIKGTLKDKTVFTTYNPGDSALISRLEAQNVMITAMPEDTKYSQILMSWLPILVIIIFWLFMLRNMQGGGNKAFTFGKSKAKMITQDQLKVTFKDVAGVDEAKEELEEIVEFLKDPQKFQRLGGKIPKGVLLVGSPGTGKTLLAKAVAGEAGVPFFSISGSDFVEMFVGVGASRVRDLFEQGKKNAPSIIFMDEIDAVGRHRGAGLGGGHDEREQTLNALLVEMDGFEATQGVILIAATNRPDVLDPALLRPGRFDRKVVVPRPDYKGRLEILKVHTRKIPLAGDVDLETIAKGTPGFAGAELANLANEAALLAARRNKNKVDNNDFEDAKDKVTMGKERRSLALSEKDKRITAYHESGHAIVARMIVGSDPVHKVTIIPRGMALGVTMQLPDDDRYNYTKEFLMGNIAIFMGGRAAEHLVFSHYSTGASSDIERASGYARKMVTEWGMSDVLGPLSFSKKDDAIFLGKEIGTPKNYSEQTAVMIDKEVSEIIRESNDKATEILRDNRILLDKMAEMLMEKETIVTKDIDELIVEYVSDKWRETALEVIEAHKASARIRNQKDGVQDEQVHDNQNQDQNVRDTQSHDAQSSEVRGEPYKVKTDQDEDGQN